MTYSRRLFKSLFLIILLVSAIAGFTKIGRPIAREHGTWFLILLIVAAGFILEAIARKLYTTPKNDPKP